MSCKVYLAGTSAECGNENRRLDGLLVSSSTTSEQDIAHRVNILESFYYIAEWQTKNLHRFKSFMLDSGAFTFAFGAKRTVVWSEYLDKYINYINDNDVKLFFELDIDKLVGYEKVIEYRKRLENGTGKRCIPVWHITRGKDDWLRTCEEYDYIALGGLAAHEFPNQERVIPWFTSTAHERGCKVHGLGYTRLKYLEHMNFDSVDSSSWLSGNIGGFVYQYRNDGCKMHKVRTPDGMRIDTKKVARHNFMQWVRLAEHMEGK